MKLAGFLAAPLCATTCVSATVANLRNSHVYQCCQGRTLRIGMYSESWQPIYEFDRETSEWGGYLIRVFQEIAKEMGLILELVPSAEEWPEGDLEEGLVDAVVVELSAPYVHYVIDPEEDEVYVNKTFSTPMFYSPVSGLVRKDAAPPSFFQMFNPFTWGLWATVALHTAFLAAMSVLVSYLWGSRTESTPPQDDGTKGREARAACLQQVGTDFMRALYNVWTTLLGGGDDFDNMYVPTKILRVALLFFVVLITATYTANLAAFLLHNHDKIHGPRTLNQLRLARVCSPFDPSDPDGGYSYVMGQFARDIVWPEHLPSTDEIEEQGISWQEAERDQWCIEQVRAGAADIWVGDQYTVHRQLISGQGCDGVAEAHWLGISPVQFGLMFRNGDVDLARNITAAYQTISQMPLQQQLLAQSFDIDHSCPERLISETAALDVEHMKPLFLILYAISCVSALVALCLRGLHRRGKKLQLQRSQSLSQMTDNEILHKVLESVGELHGKLTQRQVTTELSM